MAKTVFITAAIPYVNAAPHIGHAQEYVEADTLARYHRLIGNDVRFLCGTDDNAMKNVLKAEEAGEDVQSYVDRHAEVFLRLLRALNISNDDFIRTSTDERHRRGAQALWRAFREGDIYKKTYVGLYCIGCEEFKTEKDLVNGTCPEHPNAAPERVSEENYFFKLHAYQGTLRKLLESGELMVVPESRKHEMLAFLAGGLEDLSISRSKERAHGWGIEVPDDPRQIQYVWVDALSNYTNALGFADKGALFERYWRDADEIIHVIGKGITRFHSIYWPAFLLSARERPPTIVFSHGYLTVDGQKMSKSLGNVIDPFALIEEYGTDAFRYFFLREVSPFEDSDVTLERFHKEYNGNLANGLGNLVARVMKMAEANLMEPVATSEAHVPQEFFDHLSRFEFNRAADLVWERIGALDARITETAPFKLVKEKPQEGRALIAALVRELALIALMLEPLMPETAEKITRAIQENRMPETLFPRKEK